MPQVRSTWDGIYSEAQAKRGQALYADRCASCHAPDLSGIDQAPALAGDELVAAWNDLSLHDLFERTRISMPADKPGSLQPQEVADVIAFVLTRNNFPPGKADLPTQPDELKLLKFISKRP
jgi:S-disulfanyl-L-cysteine oxidoreductase SoxD